MKFTEEQAVEALRAELTNKGRKTLHMTEQTLVGQTAFLMKVLANNDTGLPDFVATAIESLNLIEGGHRKKDSDFAKQLKNENPEKNIETPPTEHKEENPEMKALMERIAALEKDKQENEKRVSIANKRKEISDIMKSKGVTDDEWLNDFLSEVNITADMDVEAKTAKWLKVYNKSKASGGNPVPPANPQGGGAINEGWKQAVAAAAALANKGHATIEKKD